MKLKRYIPFFAAGAGIIGAILRGLNLHTGYEEGTCLPIPNNTPQFALIVFSIVAVIFFLMLSRGNRNHAGISFEQTFQCNHPIYKAIAVISGIIMGIAGAAGLYFLITGKQTVTPDNSMLGLLPLIPLWILALLTMFSFVGITSSQAQGVVTEKRAILTIIPMFWACFDLIITFKDNGASPFVSLYAFELFAAIALVFAFYTMAGFLYAKSNPMRFQFAASLGVFFCWTCVGGYLVCNLLGGTPVVLTPESILRYVCFASASAFLLSNLFICSRALEKQAN